MSIKGTKDEWYVGKQQSNLITWSGKKITINYDDLEKIEYTFASTTLGSVIFIKRTDEKIFFRFGTKANDSVLRAIDLIKENNPRLELEKIKPISQNEPPSKSKKNTSRVSLIIMTFFVLAIIYAVGTGKKGRPDVEGYSGQTLVSNNAPIESEATNSTESEETNIFNVGDVFESDELKIMYLESGDYETTNEFMQPETGNKFIYVDLSIENVSDSDYSIGSLSFDCYADDTKCSFAITDLTEQMTSIATLSPGRNTKGRICYEVPINASNIEIELETSFWTQDKIYFIVK